MSNDSQFAVSSLRGRLVLLATIIASGMAFLDGTVVTVALPRLQADLEANVSGLQWVVDAYALTLAAFLLTGGSLGDHFGRRRMFDYGIILFAVGSLLCALSGTIGQLIAARAFQGTGAALMIPGSLAIINASFDEAHRGQAIGLWAGLAGGIASIGPLVGGWLVETLDWPSIFYINLPLGALALWVSRRFVPESLNPDARRIDWWGTATITLGLLGLAYGLIEGPIVGWSSPLILTGLIGGAAAIAAFIFAETQVEEPMVPLQLFRRPLIAGANLATFFLYFALSGVIFLLVLNLQQVQGYSPILAGLALLPPIILITFLSGPAGSLADRIGPRLPMIVGPLIVGLAMALLVLPGTRTQYVTDFLPGLVLFGLGMALVIAPLTKSALSVEISLSGIASGINNAVSRAAALMAIAVLGALVVSLFTTELASALGSSGLSEGQQAEILGQAYRLGGIEVPASFDAEAHQIATEAVRQSFVSGFRWAIGLSAALALLSSLVSVLMIRPRARLRDET